MFFKPRLREAGIEHPLGHHGIESQRGRAQAVARQHDEIIFQVMPDFRDAGIGQWAAQGGKHLFERQLRPGVVSDRDVVPFARFHRQRNAHQAGGHLVGGSGFGVERDDGGV